jgi:hypothetical protein
MSYTITRLHFEFDNYACAIRAWVDSSFTGTGHRRQVKKVFLEDNKAPCNGHMGVILYSIVVLDLLE